MTSSANSRWKNRPEGSTWGDYGPDDQLGRVNLLTPQKVKEGAAEVREGIAFCLCLPLDYPGLNVVNPRRHPPVLRPTVRNGRIGYVYRSEQDNPELLDVINDDAAVLHLQYSSQWDGLSHVGQLFDADGDGVLEPVFYNGYRGSVDFVTPSEESDAGSFGSFTANSTCYAGKLGVENMAEKCMQGRGVMVDLFAHYGRERKIVGYDDLMQVLEEDKVVVEPGDMV
ncbi:MAG: cyclase family protein, partial [Candidatus Eremiobacteraeota bacterium]|nr:cyclase family protein [Candidatus Eremiobacteraeota bacterium]